MLRRGFLAADGSTAVTVLVGGHPADGVSVAAGSDRFLIAWPEIPGSVATVPTEIRGVRLQRSDGLVQLTSGDLFAAAAGGVTQGPVATFAGTQWFVVWVEANGSGFDLRGTSVLADGTVVDDPPRVVATGVANVAPALASAADGAVLVLFARPGPMGFTAVHVAIVPG